VGTYLVFVSEQTAICPSGRANYANSESSQRNSVLSFSLHNCFFHLLFIKEIGLEWLFSVA